MQSAAKFASRVRVQLNLKILGSPCRDSRRKASDDTETRGQFRIPQGQFGRPGIAYAERFVRWGIKLRYPKINTPAIRDILAVNRKFNLRLRLRFHCGGKGETEGILIFVIGLKRERTGKLAFPSRVELNLKISPATRRDSVRECPDQSETGRQIRIGQIQLPCAGVADGNGFRQGGADGGDVEGDAFAVRNR